MQQASLPLSLLLPLPLTHRRPLFLFCDSQKRLAL